MEIKKKAAKSTLSSLIASGALMILNPLEAIKVRFQGKAIT